MLLMGSHGYKPLSGALHIQPPMQKKKNVMVAYENVRHTGW